MYGCQVGKFNWAENALIGGFQHFHLAPAAMKGDFLPMQANANTR